MNSMLLFCLVILSVYTMKAKDISPEKQKMEKVMKLLETAGNIVVITGAGFSESAGIDSGMNCAGKLSTFYNAEVMNPEAINKNPSKVWKFYDDMKRFIRTRGPTMAHKLLANFELNLEDEGKGRNLTVVTYNIDNLHTDAGSKNVLELHGNIMKIECLKCGKVLLWKYSPTSHALADPDYYDEKAEIPVKKLPHCWQKGCDGLLRPYLPWLTKGQIEKTVEEVVKVLAKCDLCLVVGPSPTVYKYRAESLCKRVINNRRTVVELNIANTFFSAIPTYFIKGPPDELLVQALQRVGKRFNIKDEIADNMMVHTA